MSPAWKNWEGRALDGRFTLHQLVQGTDSSAIFLTQLPEGPKAAIRVVRAEGADAERLLARWNQAAKIAHPSLQKIFHSGKCAGPGGEVAYLVTEAADEILGDVLETRALTTAETREMLEPILEALGYLHANGCVHGHLAPSRILAIDDRLKLSTDEIRRIGDPIPPHCEDPADISTAKVSAAGDIWSLGLTVAEVLTRKRPLRNAAGDAVIEGTLPQPFSEIARACLNRNPKQRWTLTAIGARLRQPDGPSQRVEPPRKTLPGARIALGLVGLAVAFVVFAGVRRWQSENSESPKTAAVAPAPTPVQPAPVTTAPVEVPKQETPKQRRERLRAEAAAKREAARQEAVQREAARREEAAKQQAARIEAAKAQRPPAAQPMGQPTGQPTAPTAPPAAPAESTVKYVEQPPAFEGVLRQAIPNVPSKSLATIHGKVPLVLKLSVDASGKVTDTEVISGGKTYFAPFAVAAAQRWQFAPGEADRVWSLRFNFTPAGTTVEASH